MCKWGSDTLLHVKISEAKSHTGQERFDYKNVDSCIAPIVQALNVAGIWTDESCCGHGKPDCLGYIALHEGRILAILDGKDAWDRIRNLHESDLSKEKST